MQVVEIDFTPPFRRVSLLEELEVQTGIEFPPPFTFASPGDTLFSLMSIV